MWGHRQAKDYFVTEKVGDTTRNSISKTTIREFIDRLALAESWLLRSLLGENCTVKAAAINVRVHERKTDSKPFFGDLYVVHNQTSGTISFKLYESKRNIFIWSVDVPDLSGYVDLKCNTHVLHYGDCLYTFKFPDKNERTLFSDNLNKFIFFMKSQREGTVSDVSS